MIREIRGKQKYKKGPQFEVFFVEIGFRLFFSATRFFIFCCFFAA